MKPFHLSATCHINTRLDLLPIDYLPLQNMQGDTQSLVPLRIGLGTSSDLDHYAVIPRLALLGSTSGRKWTDPNKI